MWLPTHRPGSNSADGDCSTMLNIRFRTLAFFVLAAAITRLLPHPPNMTAMMALALFGGAHFSDRRIAVIVPVLALLMSDLALGWYWNWSSMAVQPHMWVQYVCFIGVVCLGFLLRNSRSAVRIGAVMLVASCLFFIATNFAEWVFQPWYPKTAEGLVASYVAAIPFFRNMLIGDVIYTTLLFGGFWLLERRFLALRVPQAGVHAS